MIRRCPVLIPFLLLLPACTAAVPRLQATGTYVRVYSDQPFPGAESFAAEADRAVLSICEFLDAKPPHPRLTLFDSAWGQWRYLRRNCPAFSDRRSVCFRSVDGELNIVTRAGRPDAAILESVRHELVHATVAANYPEPMPWLDEGLAQVLETDRESAGSERRTRLREMASSVERRAVRLLAESDHAQLDEQDYLIAWGLVEFLLAADAFGRDAVLKCLGPGRAGETPSERLTRCLNMTPEELARRFAASIR